MVRGMDAVRGRETRYRHRVSNLRTLFMDVIAKREAYGSADNVESFLVFNIGGNQFRLIARVDFNSNLLLFKGLITHKEYERCQ